MRIATPGCCSKTISAAKLRIELVHAAQSPARAALTIAMQHFGKREAGVEAVGAGFEVERRVQRAEPREDRQRPIGDASRTSRIFGAVGTASSFTHAIADTDLTQHAQISAADMCTSLDAG